MKLTCSSWLTRVCNLSLCAHTTSNAEEEAVEGATAVKEDVEVVAGRGVPIGNEEEEEKEEEAADEEVEEGEVCKIEERACSRNAGDIGPVTAEAAVAVVADAEKEEEEKEETDPFGVESSSADCPEREEEEEDEAAGVTGLLEG